MDTHPQKADKIFPRKPDLTSVARAIDPVLDELIDGALKGALYGDDLVTIAERIRDILHEAVRRQDKEAVPGEAVPHAVPVEPDPSDLHHIRQRELR
jgi:hypothetical protein